MKTEIKLTQEELELIKSKRADAKTQEQKEQKIRSKLLEDTIQERNVRVKECELLKEKEAKFMREFFKLNVIESDPFVLVTRTGKQLFRQDYNKKWGEKYERALKYCNTSKAKKYLEKYDNNEINYSDLPEKLRLSKDIVDGGIWVQTESKMAKFEIVEIVCTTLVPHTTSNYDEKTRKHVVRTKDEPAYTLCYSEKRTGNYGTKKGVIVRCANYEYLFSHNFKSGHYDNVYIKMSSIRSKVKDDLQGIVLRIEQAMQQKADGEYTYRKFAEFCEGKDFSKTDKATLCVTYKNGVKLVLHSLYENSEPKEFEIGFDNIKLPSLYDMNVSEKNTKKYLEFITNLNFGVKAK